MYAAKAYQLDLPDLFYSCLPWMRLLSMDQLGVGICEENNVSIKVTFGPRWNTNYWFTTLRSAEMNKLPIVSEENADVLGGTAVEDVDSRLRYLINECTPWHLLKNHNLMTLYLILLPAALIPSAIIGYDASMFNGLQAVDAWDECMLHLDLHTMSVSD